MNLEGCRSNISSRLLKEPLTAGTHILGAALAVVGTIVLIDRAGADGQILAMGLVYGLSLIALFLASSLVHGLHCSEATESFLEKCDYAAIYLLIAGTYTPVCVLALKGQTGMWMLVAEWSMALIGIFLTFSRGKGTKILQVAIYLTMGWLFLLAVRQISAALNEELMIWLITGGIFYSVGAIIFILDKPHPWPGRISAHDVWHLLVLGGSTCHFMMISGLMRQYI